MSNSKTITPTTKKTISSSLPPSYQADGLYVVHIDSNDDNNYITNMMIDYSGFSNSPRSFWSSDSSYDAYYWSSPRSYARQLRQRYERRRQWTSPILFIGVLWFAAVIFSATPPGPSGGTPVAAVAETATNTTSSEEEDDDVTEVQLQPFKASLVVPPPAPTDNEPTIAPTIHTHHQNHHLHHHEHHHENHHDHHHHENHHHHHNDDDAVQEDQEIEEEEEQYDEDEDEDEEEEEDDEYGGRFNWQKCRQSHDFHCWQKERQRVKQYWKTHQTQAHRHLRRTTTTTQVVMPEEEEEEVSSQQEQQLRGTTTTTTTTTAAAAATTIQEHMEEIE